jgi:hypothetical protein
MREGEMETSRENEMRRESEGAVVGETCLSDAGGKGGEMPRDEDGAFAGIREGARAATTTATAKREGENERQR